MVRRTVPGAAAAQEWASGSTANGVEILEAKRLETGKALLW